MLRLKKHPTKPKWAVFLDHLVNPVGHIITTKDGKFQYIPKGQTKGGELFDTLQACLDSLKD